jgi:PRTRC genetic system protein C
MATTTLKTSSLPREFVFNGARIPDPDPQMSIDQVRDLLTPSYPEICNCDDDWAGGHRNEPALLLLQSHRFERVKSCLGLRSHERSWSRYSR